MCVCVWVHVCRSENNIVLSASFGSQVLNLVIRLPKPFDLRYNAIYLLAINFWVSHLCCSTWLDFVVFTNTWTTTVESGLVGTRCLEALVQLWYICLTCPGPCNQSICSTTKKESVVWWGNGTSVIRLGHVSAEALGSWLTILHFLGVKIKMVCLCIPGQPPVHSLRVCDTSSLDYTIRQLSLAVTEHLWQARPGNCCGEKASVDPRLPLTWPPLCYFHSPGDSARGCLCMVRNGWMAHA